MTITLMPHQDPPPFELGCKTWWLAGGRSSGRTTAAMSWVLDRVVAQEKPVLVVTPTRDRAREFARRLREYAADENFETSQITGLHKVSIAEVGIAVVGADEIDVIRGRSFADAVIEDADEVAAIHEGDPGPLRHVLEVVQMTMHAAEHPHLMLTSRDLDLGVRHLPAPVYVTAGPEGAGVAAARAS